MGVPAKIWAFKNEKFLVGKFNLIIFRQFWIEAKMKVILWKTCLKIGTQRTIKLLWKTQLNINYKGGINNNKSTRVKERTTNNYHLTVCVYHHIYPWSFNYFLRFKDSLFITLILDIDVIIQLLINQFLSVILKFKKLFL